MHVKLFLSTSEYSRRIILLLLVSEYWVKNRSRNGRNVVYAVILNIDALHSQPYKCNCSVACTDLQRGRGETVLRGHNC